MLDVTDGCWMLKPDGLCAIELEHGDAAFAALQEEGMAALLSKRPLPEPRSEPVLARAAYLRQVLQSWRAHHGIAGDGRLPEASRFPQRARLKAPLDVGIAVGVQPALSALSRLLLEGGRTLAETAETALAPFPVHLRSMALTALAFGSAELLVE